MHIVSVQCPARVKRTALRLTMVPLLLSCMVLGATISTQTISFDGDKTGQPPRGFQLHRTGGGRTGIWRVMADSTAPSRPNVLTQNDTDMTDYRFPLCIYESVTARDVDVSVQFKAIGGKIDQAGGLVWRYKDEDDYYVLRANALENDLRIYHVVGGKRRQFGRARVVVAANIWHTIRVVNVGSDCEAYFDGKRFIHTTDETLKERGKVGLWTKADSYTLFDDFRIHVLDNK